MGILALAASVALFDAGTTYENRVPDSLADGSQISVIMRVPTEDVLWGNSLGLRGAFDTNLVWVNNRGRFLRTGIDEWLSTDRTWVVEKQHGSDRLGTGDDPHGARVSYFFNHTEISHGPVTEHRLDYSHSDQRRPGLVGRFELPEFELHEAVAFLQELTLTLRADLAPAIGYLEIEQSLRQVSGEDFTCREYNGHRSCNFILDVQGAPQAFQMTPGQGGGANVQFTVPSSRFSGEVYDFAGYHEEVIQQLEGFASASEFDLDEWRTDLRSGSRTRQGLVVERNETLANVQTCLRVERIAGGADQCVESTVNWMPIEDLIPE